MDDAGWGTDENDPRVLASLRERGVLREKPVAGMDGIGIGSLGGGDDFRNGKIRFAAGRSSYVYRFASVMDVRRIAIGFRIHRDGRDAHLFRGAENPARDLPAVRHQQLANCLQCRNTPHSMVPSTGRLSAADSEMASTVRVSRGSIMPSSHNRAVAKYGSDSGVICASSACFSALNRASSTSIFWRDAASRLIRSITPESCCGPITAMRWFGQVNRKRGSYARP